MPLPSWLVVAIAATGRRALRALIDPTAKRLLSARYGADARAILDEIWTDAATRWKTLAPQTTFGATITVRLAALTAAAYDAFMAHHAPAEEATQTVYEIAWAVYKKMGGAAWMTSGLISRTGAGRLRLATIAFRAFPFSAPSYEWRPVPSPKDVVAFDCLACPVAEYFKRENRADLCVRTWCALDFPLAAEVWNARLERSGSIAGGATQCDFRWHVAAPLTTAGASN